MEAIRLLYEIVGSLYIWVLMPLIDFIFNSVIFLVSFVYKRAETNKRLEDLKTHIALAPAGDLDDVGRFFSSAIDNKLKELYKYKSDPLKGALNWNWRSKRVAAFLNFRGDCDDFAHLAHWFYKHGEKYTIVPLERKHWGVMHVVYVKGCRVYSASSSADGQVYEMTFYDFLQTFYIRRKIDVILLKMW